MKTRFTLMILATCMVFCNRLAASDIKSFLSNIEVRKSKFTMNAVSSEEFWAWIQFNVDQISRSQVDFGTKKLGDTVKVRVIGGLDKKITLNETLTIKDALKIGLKTYDCICLIDSDQVLVLPKTIRLDMKFYVKVDVGIYKAAIPE